VADVLREGGHAELVVVVKELRESLMIFLVIVDLVGFFNDNCLRVSVPFRGGEARDAGLFRYRSWSAMGAGRALRSIVYGGG
jgi:hypothetical protein